MPPQSVINGKKIMNETISPCEMSSIVERVHNEGRQKLMLVKDTHQGTEPNLFVGQKSEAVVPMRQWLPTSQRWDNDSSKKIMLRLDDIWEKRNRSRVLAASAGLVSVIAVVDWWTKPYWSLGFLYLFPIMLAAGFLPRWALGLGGIVCALLSEAFSSLDPSEAIFRLAFVSLALIGCGLFVSELVNNRRMSLEAQERLRILVETSPAAIVTIDERGFIELANDAAMKLIAPRDGHLIGHPIAAFLPELHHALRWEDGPQFRASMQCRGHRDNGESFTADVWFSTYKEAAAPKLAAIIGEIMEPAGGNSPGSEDRERTPLSEREREVMRLLVQGLTNKEIAVGLDVSESTVKNILQQLFAKANVRTRSQLVRVALETYRDLL